jgi:hypothetical protein
VAISTDCDGGERGITHAGVGELVEPGVAGHQGGGDRVLHVDLRLPPGRNIRAVGAAKA